MDIRVKEEYGELLLYKKPSYCRLTGCVLPLCDGSHVWCFLTAVEVVTVNADVHPLQWENKPSSSMKEELGKSAVYWLNHTYQYHLFTIPTYKYLVYWAPVEGK